jgi:predicted unusual protein kinase regulating ubiquinone biosynthesis (AarF/ABC1/UbiB family)
MGERVAIKIQHLWLQDTYNKDLTMMGKVQGWSTPLGGQGGWAGRVEQSWEGIFYKSRARLYRKIDYCNEANNAAWFAADFGIGVGGKVVKCGACGLEGKGLPSVAKLIRTPHTSLELISEEVLVMVYIPR